LSIPDP